MKDKLIVYKVSKDDMTEALFQQIVEVENSGGDPYSVEQLKELWLGNHNFDCFVCTNHHKVVGHMTFNPHSRRRNGSIYLVNLVVLSQYRRRGVGQRLLKAGCEYYLKQGCTLPFSLSVDKDNIPAITLYKKLGFQEQEPINEIEEDDTQYIMESPLEEVYHNILLKQKTKSEKYVTKTKNL